MAEMFPNGQKLTLLEKDKFILEQFVLNFPTVFSKDLYSIHVKTRVCKGKERVNQVTKF